MKYLLIKNISIGTLIERKPAGGMYWERYGFNPNKITRLCTQGEDGNGNFYSLLPVENEDRLLSQMEKLQNEIDANGIDGDSIEIVEEESQTYIDVKAAILEARS